MFIKKIFDKQYSFIRRIKFIYIINNILNYSFLKRNKWLYLKYGIKKPVWWLISGKDFFDIKNT